VRVLIVGSGGREHALAWKLSKSSSLDELHAAPGNPGIAALAECHPIRAGDAEGLLALARAIGIDLAVIGPEDPLVSGLGDKLRHAGVSVFGPTAAAARIEGSKRFAKEVLEAAGVPAAASLPIARPPCVVKADGLAGGKGVFVCRTQEELDAGLAAASAFGGPLVIEELLEGEELEALVECIHRPVLDELARRGSPFTGVLFAGLMLTTDGPRVLEFNCRFGDPEAQSILPRLDGDLLTALAAAAAGDLQGVALDSAPRAAVTVVIAGGEYPEHNDAGSPIKGADEAEALGALVFHAGTALREGRLVTSGGRILDVTGVADDLERARALAYKAVECISFEGARYRRDVAAPEGSRVG
jgi:phosphoribosylamine---glycine ligase